MELNKGLIVGYKYKNEATVEDKIQSIIGDINSIQPIDDVFVRLYQNSDSEYCITYRDDTKYLECDIFFDIDENKISISNYVLDSEDEFFIPTELFVKSMPKFIELVKLLQKS